MSEQISLLVVSLDEYRIALPTSQVQRVLLAAAVTPIPDSTPAMHGVLDVQGQLLPVLSGRLVFGIPPRPIEPEQCFVVLAAAGGSFILVCDRVQGVFQVAPADFIFNGATRDDAPHGETGTAGPGFEANSGSLLALSGRLQEITRHSVGSLPYGARVEGELVLLCSAEALANELWSSDSAVVATT